MATPVSAAAAALLWGCVLWSALLVGFWLVRSSASARWCATVVAACWLMLAVFWLLVPFEAFRLPVVLGASLLIALGLHAALVRRLRPVATLVADLARLRALRAKPLLVALAAAGGLVVLTRTARGLAAPPLGWDALTYHLLKAGRFVQSGGLAAEVAPDAWGYYEYFPPGSEIVYAWGMLPAHGDAFVAVTGLLLWIGAVVATFGAARALGAGTESSGLAALTVGLVPGVTQHLMSAYSDVALLASVLLAVVFLQRSGEPGRGREAILAAVALGLAAVIKHQGLPIAAAGALFLAWRTRQAPRWAAGAALACAAAAAVALPAYARAWIDTGSPVFPLRVAIAGREILAGHGGLTWLLYDNWEGIEGSVLPFYAALLAPRLDTLGLGPTALGVLALALIGAIHRLRAAGTRTTAVFGLVAVATCFASVHAAPVYHHAWQETAARYVLPAFGILAALAATVQGAWTRIVFCVVIAGEIALSAPHGFSEVEREALAGLATRFAPLLALAVAAAWLLRRRPLLAVSAAALLVLGSAAGLGHVRSAFRYAFYEAAAKRELWDAAPIEYASAWPIWSYLDDDERGLSLAVTAGWDGVGHNWFRYPLMGSRLQNRLHYVPVTRDGSVVDYREAPELLRSVDERRWLERLLRQEVEYVVSLGPTSTVELGFMRRRRGIFEPVASGTAGASHAFRIDREALFAWLNRFPAPPPGPE